MDIEPIRILFVEDNRIAQKMGVTLLQQLNCVVDPVTTGTDAIHSFEQQHYDLVLMDLELPDMSGLTVTEAIHKRERYTPRTPIVAVTAHGDNQHQNQATWVGMDSFLIKPLTLEKVRKTLARFVFKSKAYSRIKSPHLLHRKYFET